MDFVIFLVVAVLSSPVFGLESKAAVVVVPFADVLTRPLAPGEKTSADLRDTQVLFGEKVIVHESSGSWVLIEAVEQPEFTHHNKWEGYPGWARKDAFKEAKQSDKVTPAKTDVLVTAQNAMGAPYVWGGMSPKTGYDCSGLVHVSYRAHGIVVPRDSYEQWMKAKPIARAELQPADLIFSAKVENPKKITHVAIYAGDGQIIEAPQTGMTVRKVSFQEKYGAPFDQVESGDIVGERVIYFGTFQK